MAEETPILTIWEVSDDLWERIEILLNDRDPPKPTGQMRATSSMGLSIASAPVANGITSLKSSGTIQPSIARFNDGSRSISLRCSGTYWPPSVMSSRW